MPNRALQARAGDVERTERGGISDRMGRDPELERLAERLGRGAHAHASRARLRRSRSGQDTSPVPTLERIGPHAWKFPESAWEVSERFYTGCELGQACQTPAARAIFQDLLQRHPEHLDVRRSPGAHLRRDRAG